MDRNIGSTYGSNCDRAAAIFREGGICGDGCHEHVWAGRNNTGVFEFFLKGQVDVKGESTKCATLKTQAMEAANLREFVGMVKGDAELKLFHSMLKYNDLFVAPNIC